MTRAVTGVAILVAACAYVGCEPTVQTVRPASTTAPASRPAPLPAKALLRWEELTPKITKPVNSPGADQVPERAKAAVEEAEERIAGRDFAGAVELLERAVGYAPGNPRIRHLLGLAYAGLPNRGKALENLRLAEKAMPDNVQLQLLLGAICAAQNSDTEAIRHLRTALVCSRAGPQEPLAAEALLTLSAVLKRQGYWTAALQCQETLDDWVSGHGARYAQLAILRPLVSRRETLLISRGQLLMLLRRYGEAAETFRRAFARDRSSPRAARLLMAALLRAGDYRDAEKMLADIITEPAQRRQAPELARQLYLASGDKAVFVRLWRSCSTGEEADTNLAVSLARAALRAGAEDQAMTIGNSVLSSQPRNVAMGALMCEIYVRRGKTAEPLRMLAGMLAGDPAAARAVEEGLKRVLQAGVTERFVRNFARAAIADRSDGKHALHYVAGKLAQGRGLMPLAQDQFRRSVDAKRDFLPGYEALVDVHLAEREYEQVDQILRRIEKVLGDGHFASYIRGKAHLARGRVEQAEAALIKALEFDQRDVKAMVLLAEAYEHMGLGARSRAVARLSEALKIEPDNGEIYQRLFRHLMAAGDDRSRAQASALVRSLLRRRPRSIYGRLMLVELHLASDKRPEALSLLAALRKEAPKNVEVELMSLAVELASVRVGLNQADYQRVVQRLRAILDRQPRHLEARRMLAVLLDRQGLRAKALPQWRHLFAQAPDRVDVAAPYVRALMRAKQFEPAAGVLAEIVSRNPRYAWAREALIDALFELKRYDKAEEAARAWLAWAAQHGKKARAMPRVLRLYEAIEKYEEAQKLLDEWIQDAPTSWHLALRRKKLELYGKAKQFDKAIAYAEQWVRDGAGPAVPRILLIEVLTKEKAYRKAMGLLDEWIGQREDESVAIYRHLKVDVLGQAGRFAEAIEYARRWIDQAPDELEPRQTLVSTLARAGQYKKAAAQLETWLRRLSPPASSGPATTRASRPSTEPAAAPIRVAADRARIVRWCRQTLVRLLAMQAKYTVAAERANVFLRLDAQDTEMLSILSSCLAAMGKQKEAAAALKKALKLKPNDPELNNNLGYLYADQGTKLDEAERLIRKALETRKEAAFLDSLGWVLYKKGRFQQAAAAFREVIELIGEHDEEHPVIYDHIGDTYYRLGRAEEAVTYWKRAIEVAQKEKLQSQETKALLQDAPGKIKAVEGGKRAQVAPLGKGVKVENRP